MLAVTFTTGPPVEVPLWQAPHDAPEMIGIWLLGNAVAVAIGGAVLWQPPHSPVPEGWLLSVALLRPELADPLLGRR